MGTQTTLLHFLCQDAPWSAIVSHTSQDYNKEKPSEDQYYGSAWREERVYIGSESPAADVWEAHK